MANYNYISIDVVDTAVLCNLDIKQSTINREEVQARCPYCGDYRYRMYLSHRMDNATFWCHNCGTTGNAVTLYADFNPEGRRLTNAEVGFVGPIGLDIDVYVDLEVMDMKNFIVGANETGYHYKNVNNTRDFTPYKVADIRVITDGDKCPKCGQPIKTAQGIEVGHIFKLGTKYSDALGLKFTDESGEQKTVSMGCYGIGVTRCVAAAIEQMHDDNGIVLPVAIAPYEVMVVPVNNKEEEQMKLAEEIYEDLKRQGIEAVLDDRAERAGVKFKDSDLIGIPLRIVVGKKCGEGIVEYKLRTASSPVEMTVEDAKAEAVKYIKENK